MDCILKSYPLFMILYKIVLQVFIPQSYIILDTAKRKTAIPVFRFSDRVNLSIGPLRE